MLFPRFGLYPDNVFVEPWSVKGWRELTMREIPSASIYILKDEVF